MKNKLSKEKNEGLIELLKINHKTGIQLSITYLLITITFYVTFLNIVSVYSAQFNKFSLFPLGVQIILITLMILFIFFTYMSVWQISHLRRKSKILIDFMKKKYKLSNKDLKNIK